MTAMPVTYEAVLQIVYQLPARQRFALIHDVLKSLEPTPAKKPTLSQALGLLATEVNAPTDEEIDAWLDEERMEQFFWADQSISELAQIQGVAPIETIDDLRTNAWPADESIDEFLTTIHAWRKVDAPADPMREYV